MIVDRRNQYDVDEISDNKNLNEYKKYYENAKKYCNNVIKIENIHSFLLDNMDKVYFKNMINQMEEIVNERKNEKV